MSGETTNAAWWLDDLTDVCAQFQMDLSCLVDGELEEVASRRAIAHLEECAQCRDFFADTRNQVRAHRDLADPEALLSSYRTLLGEEFTQGLESIELLAKLSGIFYQLGKAYVVTAIQPGFLKVKMFEQAVQVGGFQRRGRGFVDGVIQSGRGHAGGLDWAQARHMLNGRLERIEDPLEKGRRLLQEALSVDPTHEEARFYLAWADKHEGKTLRAAQTFRQLFRTAVEPLNRALAVTQLGKLHADQGDHKKALACYRWVTISGLADADPRLYWVRFNIGVNYAHLGDQERSLTAFRRLIDRHPDRISDIVTLFANSESTRAVIGYQQGFAEALLDECPELFCEIDSTSNHGEEDQ